MKEPSTTIRIYVKDANKAASFMNRKGLENMAEAIRVIVEYADAHGALS